MGIFETSKIPPIDGKVELGSMLIADFPLMHFDIAASATNATILPAEDFYLGIIDNQRVKQGYYKSEWFVAGEFGFDKAIATNFKHFELV